MICFVLFVFFFLPRGTFVFLFPCVIHHSCFPDVAPCFALHCKATVLGFTPTFSPKSLRSWAGGREGGRVTRHGAERTGDFGTNYCHETCPLLWVNGSNLSPERCEKPYLAVSPKGCFVASTTQSPTPLTPLMVFARFLSGGLGLAADGNAAFGGGEKGRDSVGALVAPEGRQDGRDGQGGERGTTAKMSGRSWVSTLPQHNTARISLSPLSVLAPNHSGFGLVWPSSFNPE